MTELRRMAAGCPLAAESAAAGPDQTDAETHVHVGGNAEDCPGCKGTNPPYPFLCPGPPTVAAQPGKQTADCDAVSFRVRHNPHSWEPEPDADLVRCPGFEQQQTEGRP
jgi:hypothetical protein